MRSASKGSVILALLLASISSATAVSLASFIPRIENLPSSCATVYNSDISGCVADDFSPGATCTAACVRGLSALAESVQDKCADVDVGELSIIGVFQNGLGIQSLCPTVSITTLSSETAEKTSTKTSNQATSTQPALTTTSFTNSAIEATSTSSSSTTEAGDEDGDEEATSSVQPTASSSSTGGLVLDPNATGTFTTSAALPTDTAQAADPTRAPNAQLSNADSGGGSPFDVVAVGATSQLRASHMSIASLSAVAIMLLMSQ